MWRPGQGLRIKGLVKFIRLTSLDPTAFPTQLDERPFATFNRSLELLVVWHPLTQKHASLTSSVVINVSSQTLLPTYIYSLPYPCRHHFQGDLPLICNFVSSSLNACFEAHKIKPSTDDTSPQQIPWLGLLLPSHLSFIASLTLSHICRQLMLHIPLGHTSTKTKKTQFGS